MTTSGLSLSPGERDGKYFVVSLDSPHERMKWALVTERYGYDAPEFECGNVRDMVKYINAIAPELAQGDPASLRAGESGCGRICPAA